MPSDRSEDIEAWKDRILQEYRDRDEIDVFGPHDDNVYFVKNQLLVRESELGRVRNQLKGKANTVAGTCALGPRRGFAASQPAAFAGVSVLDVEPSARRSAAALALELATAGDDDVRPHYLVTGLQIRRGYPDGDPEPAPSPLPPLPAAGTPEGERGRGVRVAIIDTGFPMDNHMPEGLDWFHYGASWEALEDEVDADGQPLAHRDMIDQPPDGYLDVEAGHGMFVGGIIRQVAPAAELFFLKALNSDGMGTELGVARAIRYALDREVQLINLSLGFYTLGDRTPGGIAAAVTEAVDQGVAVIAAAGNDGLTAKTYPAALPNVIGVAALDGSLQDLARFSNSGPWTDVAAPGTWVQSTYVKGKEDKGLTKDRRADRFGEAGTAIWSGTSFACAHVTGHVAANLATGNGHTASAAEQADEMMGALPTHSAMHVLGATS